MKKSLVGLVMKSDISDDVGDVGTGVEWSNVWVVNVGGVVDFIKYLAILVCLATFCFST